MSDDSSSEDEITKQILKDSIDTELLTNDLYTNNCNSSDKKQLNEINSKSPQKNLGFSNGGGCTLAFEYGEKNVKKHYLVFCLNINLIKYLLAVYYLLAVVT